MRERYEAVRFAEDALVPMRDSVALAIDLYRPGRGGTPVETPLPALVLRTPYNKRSPRFVESAEFFCAHGYVVGVQDVRGRYRSGGIFTKYASEAADGYDTVEWLAALSYTDGQVGMWGTSYSAHTQADAAKLSPRTSARSFRIWAVSRTDGTTRSATTARSNSCNSRHGRSRKRRRRLTTR